MFTTIQDATGRTLATGYTPISFKETTRRTYTVAVGDYGQYVFQHWDNGSTSRSRSVALTSNVTLTAAYQTPAPVQPPPPPPPPVIVSGLYVPIYGDLSTEVAAILAARNANRSVPVVAAINPASGVGVFRSDIQAAIVKLQGAGVTVIGYVDTAYAQRPITDVEGEADLYKQWYNVSGLMLDDMSSSPYDSTYYRAITAYAHSKGLSFVMGNPGTRVESSIVGTVDCLFIYEGAGLPAASDLQTDTFAGAYPKSNFALAAYNVSTLDPVWTASAKSMVGWVFVTNGILPNPYQALPPYLTTLDGELGS